MTRHASLAYELSHVFVSAYVLCVSWHLARIVTRHASLVCELCLVFGLGVRSLCVSAFGTYCDTACVSCEL